MKSRTDCFTLSRLFTIGFSQPASLNQITFAKTKMTLVFGYTGFQVTSSSLVLVMESNANETGDLSYGVPHDNPSDFQEVAFEYSVFKFVSYMHAAHGAIYSKCDDLLWSKYKIHALMLVSFWTIFLSIFFV